MKLYKEGNQRLLENMNIITILKNLTKFKIITETDLQDSVMKARFKSH